LSEPARKSDWTGGITGILVFLGGIVLLLWTFKLAFDMFSIPPNEALQVGNKAPVELGKTAESFVRVVERILLLLVMSAVGSMIANRGIKLYAESRGHVGPPATPKPKKLRERESHVETAA
jgi:hypothetical protein